MAKKRTVRKGLEGEGGEHQGDNSRPRRARHDPSRPGTVAWGRPFGRLYGGPTPNPTGRFSEFGHSSEALSPRSERPEQYATSRAPSTSASGLLARTSAMLQRGRQRLTRRRRNGREETTDEQPPVAGPSNQQGRRDASTTETELMIPPLPPAYHTRAGHWRVDTSTPAGGFPAFTLPLPPPPPPPGADHARSQDVASSISMDQYFASPPTYPVYPVERNHPRAVQGLAGPSNVVATTRQSYDLPNAAAHRAPRSSFATATEAAQYIDWRPSVPRPELEHPAPPNSYHNAHSTNSGITGSEFPTMPRWDQTTESHTPSASGSISAMPQGMWWGEATDRGFGMLSFPAPLQTEEWPDSMFGDTVEEEQMVYNTLLPWSPIDYPFLPPDDDTH